MIFTENEECDVIRFQPQGLWSTWKAPAEGSNQNLGFAFPLLPPRAGLQSDKQSKYCESRVPRRPPYRPERRQLTSLGKEALRTVLSEQVPPSNQSAIKIATQTTVPYKLLDSSPSLLLLSEVCNRKRATPPPRWLLK